ncbi:MAG: TetR/AcrR family transcriptional regulator [bacterium]|nr:TetR/AcrR family transcriptional regulator [bacterium]
MKREEKHALSIQRIQEAAMKEFAAMGYDAASLNTICAQNGISKGIIYHYFRDKDELYLSCVAACFDQLTAYMLQLIPALEGGVPERLQGYFEGRMRYFTGHPTELGIFVSAVLAPPEHLQADISARRSAFDALSLSFLTELLQGEQLRPGISLPEVVEDFRMYMDYFNMRFRNELARGMAAQDVMMEHEAMSRRQIGILLYGILEERI